MEGADEHLHRSEMYWLVQQLDIETDIKQDNKGSVVTMTWSTMSPWPAIRGGNRQHQYTNHYKWMNERGLIIFLWVKVKRESVMVKRNSTVALEIRC